MPAPITKTLGQFAAELSFAKLPDIAIKALKTGATDCVAAMLGGAQERSTIAIRKSLVTRGQSREARLLLGGERASAMEAAQLNGSSSHILNIDDVAFFGCHTSAVLVPAILAEAEVVGASGSDMVTAYAAGYEVWARIAEREQDSYSAKGWHASAALGVLGAAAAVANLRRLSPELATTAIGIAGVMSAGIVATFNYDTKALQVGRAAANGIHAARMAVAGVTAAPDLLERKGGLLRAISPKGNIDLETPIEDLGASWRLESVGLDIKKYDFYNAQQRALDGILDLIEEHDIKPDDVTRVEAIISKHNGPYKNGPVPGKPFFPKASIEAAIAAALVTRRAGAEEASDAFSQRPDVIRVMDLVKVIVDESLPPDSKTNMGFSGKVRVYLKNGKVHESPHVEVPRGSWQRPMSSEDLWKKFSGCAVPIVAAPVARRLFDNLQRWDQLALVGELSTGLA